MNQTNKLPSVSTFFNEVITMTRHKFSRIYQLLLPAIVVFVAAIVLLMTILGLSGVITPEILASGHLAISSLPLLARIFVLAIQLVVGIATITAILAVLLDMMDASYAHQSAPTIYKTILKKLWPIALTYFGVTLFTAGGTLLLLVPGVILSIMCMFALPLTVLEDLSFEKAIARSRALTDGFKWGIFGRSLLFGLTLFVLFIVIGLLSGLLAAIHPALGVIFMITPVVFIAPSGFSFIATLYKQLNHLHDGEKKSKPFKQWFIILFIILGVVYFALTSSMKNSKNTVKMNTRMQAAQAQIDAANMTVPAETPLPTAPAVQ